MPHIWVENQLVAFPDALQIPGYRGQALVVVSCVTKESPYRPHPHELDGDNCRHGILRKEVSIAENMSISFEKVYLVRSKIVDIQKNLEVRKKNCIDPFQTGNFPPVTGGDMHGIRLCFEVFLPPQEPYHHERWHPLDPVVSDPIANRRASKILRIHKLSHTSASVAGGQEVMMFCDDIKNINNIEVTFFDNQGWEANASFNPSTDIHRKVGIFFRTPAYHNLRIWEPLTIFVQLREPRDGFHGEPHEFTLQPQEVAQIEHKKRKLDRNSSHCQALMNLVPGHTPFAFRQRPDSTLYESSVGKNIQFESLPDLMEQPSISGQNKHVDPLLNLKNSMQPVVEHWMLSELHSSSCTNATYSGPPPEIFDFHEHQAQSDQIGQNLLLNKNLIEGMTLNVPGINCLPGVNPAECPLTSLVHEACDPGEDEAVTVSLSMPALTAILNSVEETIQARIQDSAEGEKM